MEQLIDLEEPTTAPGTGTAYNPVTGVNGVIFAYADPESFDGITGSNIAKAAGYSITTGLYKNGARNTTDYSVQIFFILQLIQILLQKEKLKEEELVVQ